MATALIGIGANLGNASETVRRALDLLAETDGISVANCSRLYRTCPAGGPAGQEPFVNAAAVLETNLAPHALLQKLHEVEGRFGRTRAERWGPRTLDLDLLLYDEQVIDDNDLVVPHPRMSFRRFVLEPAAEIAPDFLHPTSGRPIGALLKHVDAAPQYVAIGSLVPAAGSSLATALARDLGSPLIRLAVEGAATQTTVPPLRGTLEFAKRGSDLLSRGRWKSDPHLRSLLAPGAFANAAGPDLAPAVSSFWLDQWRLWACLCRPDEEAPAAPQGPYRQVVEQCVKCQEVAVPPKLVVWIDRSPFMTPSVQERMPDCLESLFRQSACGAVLRLKASDDSEWMVEESRAAMEAMRPLEGVIS